MTQILIQLSFDRKARFNLHLENKLIIFINYTVSLKY